LAEVSSDARVARGASYLFVQGLVSNLAGIVYFGLAARLLPSVADLGRATALGVLGGLFATAGGLSLPSAVVKFVSEYTGGGRSDEASGVFWTSLRTGVMLALFSSIICLATSGFLASYVLGSSEYAYLVDLLAVDAFLLVLWPFLQAGLQGLKRFDEMGVIGITNSLLSYGGSILALLLGMGLTGIVLGSILGDIASTGLWAIMAFRAFKQRGTHPLGPLIRYSAPLYSSSLTTYLQGSVDRYLILLLAGQTVLGIYSPAATAAGVSGAILGTIGVLLFPLLSERQGGFDSDGFRETSRLFSRYVFLVYVPFAVAVASLAYPIVDIFVGDRFLIGALPLAILALGSALTCGSVVVNSVLLAVGRTRIFAVVSLFAIMVNVALSFVLIGPYGAVGAAIARLATLFVSFGLTSLGLLRLHGHNLDWAVFARSLAAASLMALVLLGLQLVWLREYLLPLYAVVGALVYLLGLKALKALRQEDIALAEGLLPANVRWVLALIRRFAT
jgi:PST family polysaccharide transporter